MLCLFYFCMYDGIYSVYVYIEFIFIICSYGEFCIKIVFVYMINNGLYILLIIELCV